MSRPLRSVAMCVPINNLFCNKLKFCHGRTNTNRLGQVHKSAHLHPCLFACLLALLTCVLAVVWLLAWTLVTRTHEELILWHEIMIAYPKESHDCVHLNTCCLMVTMTWWCQLTTLIPSANSKDQSFEWDANTHQVPSTKTNTQIARSEFRDICIVWTQTRLNGSNVTAEGRSCGRPLQWHCTDSGEARTFVFDSYDVLALLLLLNVMLYLFCRCCM